MIGTYILQIDEIKDFKLPCTEKESNSTLCMYAGECFALHLEQGRYIGCHCTKQHAGKRCELTAVDPELLELIGNITVIVKKSLKGPFTPSDSETVTLASTTKTVTSQQLNKSGTHNNSTELR